MINYIKWLKSLTLIAVVRHFHIHLLNGDHYELDLFFLINNEIPLWIECKAGKFRASINKYKELCKRLKFDKKIFLLLVSDVADDKRSGLSSTFDINIVNENNFLSAMSGLIEYQ